MIKIYVYSCLLSVLSIVEMKPLNIKGRVGQNVTFTCSDWNTWTDVKSNVKYFCKSPCSEDKHIIKAAFKGTERKNRIVLTNSADGLFVTFINLKKSDSGKYYCGAERLGPDGFIEVNLKVTDAESPSPRTTPKPVIIIHTVSSSSSDTITDTSTSFNIHPTTTGAGSAPYVIAGLIFIIILLVVLLMLTRRMMKQQPGVFTTQQDLQEDAREVLSAGPVGVYQSVKPSTNNKDQVYSTLNPTESVWHYTNAGPDGVYQSLHPFTTTETQVYSTLNPRKTDPVLEKMPVDSSSSS